jgi:hypothetical protein
LFFLFNFRVNDPLAVVLFVLQYFFEFGDLLGTGIIWGYIKVEQRLSTLQTFVRAACSFESVAASMRLWALLILRLLSYRYTLNYTVE